VILTFRGTLIFIVEERCTAVDIPCIDVSGWPRRHQQTRRLEVVSICNLEQKRIVWMVRVGEALEQLAEEFNAGRVLAGEGGGALTCLPQKSSAPASSRKCTISTFLA
jgi:hypothetical protein